MSGGFARVALALVAVWLPGPGPLFAESRSVGTESPAPLSTWRALDREDSDDAERWACWQDGAAGDWSVGLGPAGAHASRAARVRAATAVSSVPVPDTAEFSGPRAVLERPDGVWLGIDRGEFGGGLWWLPRGGGPAERVSQENVRGIVVLDGKVTAISGLAHMGWNQGALLEPVRAGQGGWKLGRIRPLGAAPQAWALQSSDTTADVLWIATYQAVLRIEGDRMRRVHGVAGWPLIDSLAVTADGVIFLGMRGGVGRLTPSWRGHRAAWLVPPSCAEVDPETCECRSRRTEDEPWPTTKP